MKLLGRDIPTGALLARIEERLRTRGLPTSEAAEVPEDGVEPRVDPLTFNMHALEENADTTRALPLHTHRGGAGQVVLLAKWAFRKSCQVLINETLGRQRVFNGLVRDSYAQLSAEVLRLRREVDTLRAQAARAPRAEGARPSMTPGFEPTRHPKPPPDIEYGHPSMPAHDGHSRGPRPLASEDGRARPPKPPPDIAYGRPAKPSHAEHGEASGPSVAKEQRPPAKPPRAVRGQSVKGAEGRPTREPSRPERPRSRPPATRRSTKPSSGGTRGRPSKPPASHKVPPGPEEAPGPTGPAPATQPPARGSRAKRGGPKKK